MRKLRSLAVVTAAVALATISSTTAASAAPSQDTLMATVNDEALPVQTRIDAQLQLAPGGTQISANEVSYTDEQVLVSFPAQGARTAPTMSAAAQTTAGMVPAGTTAEKSASVQAVAAASVGGCPTATFGKDWYCFYADANYGGRRLQWSDAYPISGGGVDFRDFGFLNQTSSWVNGGGKYVDVWYVSASGARLNLFTMTPHTSSRALGTFENDRAGGFYTRG